MAKKKQITSKSSKNKKKSNGENSVQTPSLESFRLDAPISSAPGKLIIELLSDTTFSRGHGTAAQVDTEVEHDSYGLPYIGARTVRGLLRDTWLSMSDHFSPLHAAAERVLGANKSLDDTCKLRIGDALLPEAVRQLVREANERDESPLQPRQLLDAFTTIRYQTAQNRETGAPEDTTLRSSRVVLRGMCFEAPLTWSEGYTPKRGDIALLALCARSTRHGGLLRNRGRGHLKITLEGEDAAIALEALKGVA